MPIHFASMTRPLATACLLLLLAFPSGAEDLPLPESLEPAVDFWTRVYSEVDSQAGLIHDSVELGVVYETVRLPEDASRRTRERIVEKKKEQIRAILNALAKGKREGLSGDEARVLARWPEDVSNATLRKAAGNLRFQRGLADRFEAGLVRSGRWRSHIVETMKRHGVPEELVALPHVESSYNPGAYSSVGASGLWQFMRSTGRLFMRIDSVIDERLDPYIATDAAARLLAKNYEITGTWPLAITAYNHGAGGMKRASRTLGTTDMGEIVRRYRSRTFGFASRNFYASFLAASRIDRDPTRYFGEVEQDAAYEYETIEVPFYTPASTLAEALGVELALLREFNPALRPAVWNGSKYVPKRFALRLPAAAVAGPVETLVASIPQASRFAEQHRDRYHKVRRGETLSRIARRYGVRESELVALNNLRSRHRIRVGQVLVLPDGPGGGRPAPISVARQPLPDDGVYRVARGDTLGRIATRFGVTEKELAASNGIRNRHHISVGQPLRIPGAVKPAVVASASPPAPERAASGTPAKPPAPEPEAKPAPPDPEPAPAAAPPVPKKIAATPAPTPTPTPPPATPEPAANGSPQDPSDYAVHGNRIRVQAAETLGHYAEWLEVRASQLRSLNGMRFEEPVVIGRRIKLDFARVSPAEFERRRLEYHQTLQTEFFDAFVVTGTERHVLARGESLWYLAKRKYKVPVWLLRQYNPDLDFAALPAGAPLIVPIVEARTGV